METIEKIMMAFGELTEKAARQSEKEGYHVPLYKIAMQNPQKIHETAQQIREKFPSTEGLIAGMEDALDNYPFLSLEDKLRHVEDVYTPKDLSDLAHILADICGMFTLFSVILKHEQNGTTN